MESTKNTNTTTEAYYTVVHMGVRGWVCTRPGATFTRFWNTEAEAQRNCADLNELIDIRNDPEWEYDEFGLDT